MIYILRMFRVHDSDRLFASLERERLSYWSYGKVLSWDYEDGLMAEEYEDDNLLDEDGKVILRPIETFAVTQVVDTDDYPDSAFINSLAAAHEQGTDCLFCDEPSEDAE